ncbi:MAG TPA: transglutaminase domain-containing protein [Steroidobacteraceae bacterium]|nr:transglutaminase domain-containing protein [Steroidobacteraceae bacterium]
MTDAQYSRPSVNLSATRLGCAVLLLMLAAGAHSGVDKAGADQTGVDDASARKSGELDGIQSLIDHGRFKSAEARITSALARPTLASAEKQALEYERERMRRMRLDFTLTADEAQARLRKQIPDLKPAEFAAWDAAGLIERLTIDGQTLYFNRAPSNLFRLSDAALKRRGVATPPWTDGPMEIANAHHREIRDQALATGQHSVAPRRVRVTYSVTVDADAVPKGETVRAWLPFPRAIAGQQENIRLVQSTPAQHEIAPEEALQRTVYLERAADAGKTTDFSITYELTVFGQYHAIDPDKVKPAPHTPELSEFIAERRPHIVFTPDVRKLSRDIVGSETDTYRIARKLFDAVDRIPWAGAREYSTITNLSDYTLHAGHGDCGQQTLLLMTLLRLNGIPTRWQSGWVFSEGDYDNMHDWAQIYLAPYGWVPMDVTFGGLKSGDAALDGFYLGGLDAYRLAFNDDFSRPFVPAKKHFRSDTVDSQRGEVEWRGGNLYYDQWDYEFKAQVLAAK